MAARSQGTSLIGSTAGDRKSRSRVGSNARGLSVNWRSGQRNWIDWQGATPSRLKWAFLPPRPQLLQASPLLPGVASAAQCLTWPLSYADLGLQHAAGATNACRRP